MYQHLLLGGLMRLLIPHQALVQVAQHLTLQSHRVPMHSLLIPVLFVTVVPIHYRHTRQVLMELIPRPKGWFLSMQEQVKLI